MKKGVSLTVLIVTVMVLVIVTGTLIVNTNSDKNIIDETTQIINQNNKKVIIQEIQNKLQIKRIENSNKGIYNVGVEEYVIPILQQYGTFDRGSFRLVTNKDNIVIYLDEIIKIPLKEYVQVEYENNVLKITTELTDKGYTVEYATSKDGIWQEYVSEVDVETDEGIYVRLKNNNDKIVSSINKVYNNEIDITSPVITIQPNGATVAKNIPIVITVTDDKGINSQSEYMYYISDSTTITENVQWEEFVSGESIIIGEGLTGTYYVHVKGVEDEAGNRSENAVSNAFVFDNLGPTVSFSVNGNNTYQKMQSTTINIDDTENVSYKYGWSQSDETAPTSWTSSTSKSQITTQSTGTGTYFLWIKDLKDDLGNAATVSTVGGVTTINAISNVFALDNSAPNSFTPTIADITTTTITLNASTTDNNGGAITYYYSANNGSTWLPTGGTTQTQYTITGLTEDTQYSQLKVKAVDSAGNDMTTSNIDAITHASIWNGNVDIGWYVRNPSATTFNIRTPQELAGLAILTANIDTTVYYDKYYYANTTSGAYSTTGLNFSGKTINITSDINLNNNAWAIGGTFAGTLNGNGKTISGLYCTTTVEANTAYASFMTTNSGTIKRLIISDATLSSRYGRAGGFAISNSGTIDSCAIVNSTVKGRGGNYTGAGGIAYSGGLIINSYNAATVSLFEGCTNYFCGQSWVGGITGADGIVVNCYNAGTVTGGCRAGGFSGTQGWESTTPKKLNSYNKGQVTGQTSGAGFGIGWIQGGTIQYCYGYSSYSTKAVGGTETTATITNNNNTTFSGSGTTWTLAANVSPNGTATNNLLTALNAWVTANGGVYSGVDLSTWKVDSSKNGGMPIFDWQ